MINPLKLEKVTGSPAMIMIAIAQATIFMVLPAQMDRCAKRYGKDRYILPYAILDSLRQCHGNRGGGGLDPQSRSVGR